MISPQMVPANLRCRLGGCRYWNKPPQNLHSVSVCEVERRGCQTSVDAPLQLNLACSAFAQSNIS